MRLAYHQNYITCSYGTYARIANTNLHCFGGLILYQLEDNVIFWRNGSKKVRIGRESDSQALRQDSDIFFL